MKKNITIVLLLIIGLLISACGTGSAKYGKGQEMSLDFETNPSTGYDWIFETIDEEKNAFIYLVNQENNFPENNLVGMGGHRIYYFRATTPGKQVLTFTYKRPWEGGEVAYDVVYELDVDKDLNITCTNKKKGKIKSDKELSFFPDPVFS